MTFKIIEKYEINKEVEYFNHKFIVPCDIIYLAVDKDGTLRGFYSKPIIAGDCFTNYDICISMSIAELQLSDDFDWYNSLMVV